MEPQPTQQTVKTENYRQQLIIPDDTNTTVANTNIEETQGSNFMEEASNHSTVIMSDKTVTSPTSQFGNLSFQPVSQEPLSFAGKNFYITDCQFLANLCNGLFPGVIFYKPLSYEANFLQA